MVKEIRNLIARFFAPSEKEVPVNGGTYKVRPEDLEACLGLLMARDYQNKVMDQIDIDMVSFDVECLLTALELRKNKDRKFAALLESSPARDCFKKIADAKSDMVERFGDKDLKEAAFAAGWIRIYAMTLSLQKMFSYGREFSR